MSPKIKVKIKNDARIYIHNDLMNAVFYLKRKIDERSKNNDRDGIALEIMSCLVMIAFSFEAQINFLGHKLLPNWEERKPYLYKYKKVSKKLDVDVDYESRPHSTIKELKEFRDILAHGKPKEIVGEEEIEISEEELENRDLLKAEWEDWVTDEFLQKAYEDTEAAWRNLLEISKLSIVDTITSGGRVVQILQSE